MSRTSGIDASLISRYRTGSRKPTSNSSQFKKLCKGIVLYAEANFLWKALENACQLADIGNLENRISTYLLPENKIKDSKSYRKPTPNTYCFFGEKLNALMSMLGLSNIRLAKVMNVDSSLISRLRNGLRTPPKDSPLIINMSNYFYKRVRSAGFEKELSELLFIPETMVVNGGEKLINHIIAWLFDNTEVQNVNAMDNFLEKLNSFSINTNHQLPSIDALATDDLLNECIHEYIGIDGLRRAVIRFLGSAACSNQSRTLKLYSDQSMDWLTSDSDFSKKWSLFMLSVIIKKNPIQIIHNIDRGLPEMLAAIENWLPLYMSGMITSFYCKKPNYNRFSHTLFVAPGLAAINANFVTGTEHSGKYHYHNNDENLIYYESQFDALMEVSRPLVQVFYGHNIAEHHFFMGEFEKTECITKKMLSSLSIATMPRELLEKILIRNELSHIDKSKILLLHETYVQQFEYELATGNIIEYTTLPTSEDLLAGKVKLNLMHQFLLEPISYTREEYKQHLSNIISLLEKNTNYNFSPLTYSPFENIQIIMKSDISVMVLKNLPAVSFLFGHPMMCQAFDEYLDAISKRICIAIHGRKDLIHFLNNYDL